MIKKFNLLNLEMMNIIKSINLLKLNISYMIQPIDIKYIFLMQFQLMGIDKFEKICFNSINHQGG